MNMAQQVTVGETGRGLLEISQGGVIDAGTLVVGGLTRSPAAGEGNLNLLGSNSTLRVKSNLTIGSAAFGEAYLAGGALLQSGTQASWATAVIGDQYDSVGQMYGDGSDTAWQHNGTITVGNDGNGLLQITGGASVSSHGTRVGRGSGYWPGAGTFLIDGPGSRWVTGSLLVGDDGAGVVHVTGGALIDVVRTSSEIGFSLGWFSG